MLYRAMALAWLCLALAGCANFPARNNPITNSGYDWTDQVRDAQGNPLPGWGNAVAGGGGFAK